MSLRTRVTVAVGLVVCCVLATAAAVLYPLARANLNQKTDQYLQQAAASAPTEAKQLKLEQTPLDGRMVPFGSSRLQILPSPVPGPGGDFVPVTKQDLAVAWGQAPPYFQTATFKGTEYTIYTAPFPGIPGALVRAAQPTAATASTEAALGWLLIAGVPAGALIAGLLARLAAGRVLRPVGRLTETVERIRATGDLSTPIDTPGRDEVSRLGQAFAAMTAALDGSVTAQRRLVADASHELRTPLTSLITNLELLREQPDDPKAPDLAAAALAEAGQLRALVNDLVELARDGAAPAHAEDVRLDLVAERVANRAAARAPELRVTADCRPTLVYGDPDALERAVGNLVDNAVKWSPPGGTVLVRAADGTGEVSDEGPGVPAEDLPYIFDRFYRSAGARALPGSGLGLAIVRRIADAHHGTVQAVPLRQGVLFRLSLPEAADLAGDDSVPDAASLPS